MCYPLISFRSTWYAVSDTKSWYKFHVSDLDKVDLYNIIIN